MEVDNYEQYSTYLEIIAIYLCLIARVDHGEIISDVVDPVLYLKTNLELPGISTSC